RNLWSDAIHDRNAHFATGLSWAEDIRHGRLLQFISDFDKARTWPPLHDGALVGITSLISGGDPRWAVLPSLAGWVMAIVFAFLLARRCVAANGNIAGAAASLFVAVSPAMRAFATDVMLESLGAGLTLAVLYAYVVAVQNRSSAACRWLAVGLTALIFEKYNYWLVVVFALVAADVCRQPR